MERAKYPGAQPHRPCTELPDGPGLSGHQGCRAITEGHGGAGSVPGVPCPFLCPPAQAEEMSSRASLLARDVDWSWDSLHPQGLRA